MAHDDAPSPGPSTFVCTGLRIRVGLDGDDREFLAQVLTQVRELLEPAPGADGPGAPAHAVARAEAEAAEMGPASDLDRAFAEIVGHIDRPVGPPADPAVARLLPDAHRDDPALAAEFRRLSEATLRERKQTNAALAAAALVRPAPVLLDRAEASALLKAMNDVRLVLSARLGIETEQDADRVAALAARLRRQGAVDGVLGTVAVYEVLGVWLEHLVGAVEDLDDELGPVGPPPPRG